MKNIKKIIFCFLLTICFVGCENEGDMLDDFLEQGPIIYAAKIESMDCQSGFKRIRVNIVPGDDVNRASCLLKWNITSEVQDSLLLDYTDSKNFDSEQNCFFALIDFKDSAIQGNLEIRGQNIDTFGNRSLIYKLGAYIYGDIYVSSLLNDAVLFSKDKKNIIFNKKLGSVGNFISYEQIDGTFTTEIFTEDETFPLVNAKPGGIIKNKTRYLVQDTDIDMLDVNHYSETIIP